MFYSQKILQKILFCVILAYGFILPLYSQNQDQESENINKKNPSAFTINKRWHFKYEDKYDFYPFFFHSHFLFSNRNFKIGPIVSLGMNYTPIGGLINVGMTIREASSEKYSIDIYAETFLPFLKKDRDRLQYNVATKIKGDFSYATLENTFKVGMLNQSFLVGKKGQYEAKDFLSIKEPPSGYTNYISWANKYTLLKSSIFKISNTTALHFIYFENIPYKINSKITFGVGWSPKAVVKNQKYQNITIFNPETVYINTRTSLFMNLFRTVFGELQSNMHVDFNTEIYKHLKTGDVLPSVFDDSNAKKDTDAIETYEILKRNNIIQSIPYEQRSMFDHTPTPLNLLKRAKQEHQLITNGKLTISYNLGYRIFPFFSISKFYFLKGFFLMIPSLHIGHALSSNFNKKKEHIKGQTSYSIVGSIGYNFPNNAKVTVGVGWNNKEGLVINIVKF